MGDGIELRDVVQVTRGYTNHEHPVFSPDGRRLAWYAGDFGYLQLYVGGIDGHAVRPLTCARGNHTQPAWDPAGAWIYYRQQPLPDAPWAIWRVLVDDPGRRERLLDDRRVSYKHPSVSPDGRWLAWFSDEGTPGNYHLFKGRLGRRGVSGAVRLTADRDRNDCHPTWSPDGSWLAFHAYEGREEASVSHIYVCDASGGQLRRLTNEAAFHKHPFFVGRDLLTHHTEEPGGRRFVALRRVRDGAFVGRLTSGKHNDKHPSPWVPSRGPVRICFASKKRGDTADGERDHSYDVFWGRLAGVAVRR